MSAFRIAAGVRADEPTAVERVFGRYSAALGDVHEFEATGDLARVTRVGSTSNALTSAARDPVRELVERRVGELPSGDPVTDVVEIIASVGGLLGKLLD